MADPLIEQIAQLVKSRLEEISAANHYETDIEAVLRPTRMAHVLERVQHLSIVISQGDAEPAEDDHYPGNPSGFAWRQPFLLDLIVRPSEETTTPLDQTINAAVADIQKAMMSDPHWSDGTDELAINTFPVGTAIADDPQDGKTIVTCQYDIVYRTDEDDPYTQAP